MGKFIVLASIESISNNNSGPSWVRPWMEPTMGDVFGLVE